MATDDGTLDSTWVRVDKLTVDRTMGERPLNPVKVRKIAREFDPDAIGSIYVSLRKDGTYVILDGQHRHAALLAMDWGDQQVPCVVYEGLTRAQEADLFVKFNENRTRPRPFELHNAAVIAGQDDAIKIQKVLDEVGLAFCAGPMKDGVQAVGAMYRIYKRAGAKALHDALLIAKEAWDRPKAYNGDLIWGLAMTIVRYRPRIDRQRLIARLKGEDPADIVTRAMVIKSAEGTAAVGTGRLGLLVHRHIVQLYNARLSAGRLNWVEPESDKDYWKLVPSRGRGE